MKFSQIHDWQNDSAVKQILVFPSELLQDEFNKAFAERVEKDGIEKASDNNIGAIYKLRAVLCSTGRYESVIRCGHTGELLWEDSITYPTIERALICAITNLWCNIKSDCRKLIKLIDETKDIQK